MAEIDDDVWDEGSNNGDANGGRGGGGGDSNSPWDRGGMGKGQTVTVVGDPTSIEQVILSLVNNAVRHTTVGFVTVKVRRVKFPELAPSLCSMNSGARGHGNSGQVCGTQDTEFIETLPMPRRHDVRQLSQSSRSGEDEGGRGKGDAAGGGGEPGDKFVVIEVCDSGCGILDKDRMHIADESFRGDADCKDTHDRDPRISGGGLGLKLCRQLVAAHDSNISIQSVANFGRAFFFSLTRAKPMQSLEEKPRTWSKKLPICGICVDDSHLRLSDSEVKAMEGMSNPPYKMTGAQSAQSARRQRAIYMKKVAESPLKTVSSPSKSSNSSVAYAAWDSHNSECGQPSRLYGSTGGALSLSSLAVVKTQTRKAPPAPLLVQQPQPVDFSDSDPTYQSSSTLIYPASAGLTLSPSSALTSRLSFGSSKSNNTIGTNSCSPLGRTLNFIDVLDSEDTKTQGRDGRGDQGTQGANKWAAVDLRNHTVTRVLVVDDNEDSLLGMVNMLVSSGFIVEIARSGKECHQLLAARIGTDDAPDVVGAALDVIS